MRTSDVIHYLDAQAEAISALIKELNEVQVQFNARFDEFKAQHDAKLDELTELAAERTAALDAELRAAIEARLPEERGRLEARRQKVREEYLPQRQQAADELLTKAQAEQAALRTLNPKLDRQEEGLKAEKAELEARLGALNEEIRQKSRGLGVVRHFLAILRADRDRQRIIGKLEKINDDLHDVRREWEKKRKLVDDHQAELRREWQLESIAVARLQTELDRLDDEAGREALARRRAIRHVLDGLKAPASAADPALAAGLEEMVALNVQTDDYHAGLASVGGLIGLLRGIRSGLKAVRKSLDGLYREEKMHSEHLRPLRFSLPPRVEAFHKQWSPLAYQFADEAVHGQHPVEFAASVEPLLEGPLSQAHVERMFDALGDMIRRATAGWG